MYTDNKIWVANNANGEKVFLLPKMANRHGLVAGATGTGKTITLKVLAEGFSDMGVPVFLADVKGDLSGMVCEGKDSDDMRDRIRRFCLDEAGFSFQKYPATYWDVFGQKGIPLRTTVSEMGPLLLSRILGLNDLQRDILSITFKIADDNDLLLVDTKDLKAMLNYVSENNKEFAAEYGNISKVSIAAIVRAIVSLEIAGADKFFFEPALNIRDWFTTGEGKCFFGDVIQPTATQGALVGNSGACNSILSTGKYTTTTEDFGVPIGTEITVTIDKNGTSSCYYEDDRWLASAVQCGANGGRLPSDSELESLAAELYPGASESEYNSYTKYTGTLTIPTELQSTLSGLGSSWYYLWSSSANLTHYAWSRYFDSSYSRRIYSYRYSTYIRAVCVGD